MQRDHDFDRPDETSSSLSPGGYGAIITLQAASENHSIRRSFRVLEQEVRLQGCYTEYAWYK